MKKQNRNKTKNSSCGYTMMKFSEKTISELYEKICPEMKSARKFETIAVDFNFIVRIKPPKGKHKFKDNFINFMNLVDETFYMETTGVFDEIYYVYSVSILTAPDSNQIIALLIDYMPEKSKEGKHRYYFINREAVGSISIVFTHVENDSVVIETMIIDGSFDCDKDAFLIDRRRKEFLKCIWLNFELSESSYEDKVSSNHDDKKKAKVDFNEEQLWEDGLL